MSDLRYIEQDGRDGPLCPNTTTDPLHLLVVKIQNAMYEVMDRDGDDVSPPEQERLYGAVRDAAPIYMRLYVATSTPSILGQGSSYARAGTYVEAWFFKCPTCELTLPASGVRRSDGR